MLIFLILVSAVISKSSGRTYSYYSPPAHQYYTTSYYYTKPANYYGYYDYSG
jgi:hypothetical protein